MLADVLFYFYMNTTESTIILRWVGYVTWLSGLVNTKVCNWDLMTDKNGFTSCDSHLESYD